MAITWKISFVNKKTHPCVSLAIMSPLTAKLKCSHYGKQSEFKAVAVEKVASSQDGVRGADDFERGD